MDTVESTNPELNQAVNAAFEKQLNMRVADAAHNMLTWLLKGKYLRDEVDFKAVLNFLKTNGVEIHKAKKPKQPKQPKLILPYIPIEQDGCIAIIKGGGLYTQCTKQCVENTKFCKYCTNAMVKNNNTTPEFGTIQDRMKFGVMDYTDKKGEKPIPFGKINKFTKEEIINAAKQKGINPTIIPSIHFEPYEQPKKTKGNKKTPAATIVASNEPPATQQIEEEEEETSAFELVDIFGTSYLIHIESKIAYAHSKEMDDADGGVAEQYATDDGDYDINKLKRIGTVVVNGDGYLLTKDAPPTNKPAAKPRAKK